MRFIYKMRSQIEDSVSITRKQKKARSTSLLNVPSSII